MDSDFTSDSSEYTAVELTSLDGRSTSVSDRPRRNGKFASYGLSLSYYHQTNSFFLYFLFFTFTCTKPIILKLYVSFKTFSPSDMLITYGFCFQGVFFFSLLSLI